jgi:hypothetical protein
LFVKFAPFLDGGNASIRGKEDADRINFLPFTSHHQGLAATLLLEWKHVVGD